MIARLKGTVVSTAEDHAVIDVGGVGYLVEASARTLDAMGAAGAPVTVHTELLVGEGFQRLVGFASAAERDWFRRLKAVQGVGAKVALAILSVLEPDELARALADGNTAAVGRASGVGPKLATRVVNELKDKVGAIGVAGVRAPAGGSPDADAVSALANLGFKAGDAAAAVAAARKELGAGATLDPLVRAALKRASRA